MIHTELKSKELYINFHMNSESFTRSGKTNYNIHITQTLVFIKFHLF